MSGVIYAVIVAMWAAFLVPMWLRRHDEAAAEARSVARFSTAMRVLARRATAESSSETPQRSESSSKEATVMINRRPVPSASAALGVRTPATDEHHSRHRSLAERRRRVLLVLCAVTLVAALLVIAVSFPLVGAVVPALLTVAYVAHLRVQARRTAEIARARRAGGSLSGRVDVPVRSRAMQRSAARLEAASASASRSRLATTKARAEDVVSATTSAKTARAEDAAEEPAYDGNADVGDVDDGFAGPRVAWEPVRVPTPTYVTAATAVHPVRTIDLTAPGAWTSGRLVSDAVAAAARAVGERPAAADTDRDDDDTMEHRLAVGD